jgi:hypothetical protein
MLTPKHYWRVPLDFDDDLRPSDAFALPETLACQRRAPKEGDGITAAAYCNQSFTGFFRWIGLIVGDKGAQVQVAWQEVDERIWVQSSFGRKFWNAGAFGFADKKVTDYGLHDLWARSFEGMTVREQMKVERALKVVTKTRRAWAGEFSQGRLSPIEVIGSPTASPRTGVVYLLKSAYGYKVGRTGNVPARMRAFGVQLPFAYTIPFCIWFDDCHDAERRFHDAFAEKRINGEWFDLGEEDISAIRTEGLLQALDWKHCHR